MLKDAFKDFEENVSLSFMSTLGGTEPMGSVEDYDKLIYIYYSRNCLWPHLNAGIG